MELTDSGLITDVPLNVVTKVDTFSMPRVNNLLDQLGGAKFFTTLELPSGSDSGR